MAPRTRAAERPKTADEVYAQQPRFLPLRKCGQTETDVARAVLELDETLASGVLCFEEGEGRYVTYVANYGGIWEKQLGSSQLKSLVRNVRDRIQLLILEPLRDLAMWLKSRSAEDELVRAKAKQASDAAAHLEWIHLKLGGSAFLRAVVFAIMEHKVITTAAADITSDAFDTHPDALGFTDGVYDFKQGKLVAGWAATEYYVSRTTGFSYEDMMEVGEADLAACDEFLAQVHPKPENREYLLVSLRSAARRLNRQVIMVHYNAAGANGKSTLFALVKHAFGSLYTACSPTLLVASSFNNPNAANEELMSARGACVVLFTEPSANTRLSAAIIKKLTGGDDQSARSNYGHKQTFVLTSLLNLVCNKIPECDDMDGGMQRRLRCFPYNSSFVEAGSPRLGQPGVFPIRRDLEPMFKGSWRMCLMRRILEAPDECADPPDVVQHTKQLVERESIVGRFADLCVLRTGTKSDTMTVLEAWSQYKVYHEQFGGTRMSHSSFETDLVQVIGPYKAKSGNMRCFWRGFLARPPPLPDAANSDTSSPLERAFRAVLETRGYVMPKARPDWLRYPKTGATLELDFYDEEQQVAIEYDGAQHYEYPNQFHKSREEFEEQVARDRWKDAQCDAMGVQLVRIRATGNSEQEAADAIDAMGQRCS